MGHQEKEQVIEMNNNNSEIWVIAGISLRAPLRPMKAKAVEKRDEDRVPATPVKNSRKSVCPPAPKKAKPSLVCRLDEVQFFSVPEDLASVFVPQGERAK
ncbi:cyclin-dependent protein kinase inhibitor SMR6 [Asparagus officinalis]|nr:cyclin-dependent protein kinase inhibitor SMR6 [Asparagus officinalis]